MEVSVIIPVYQRQVGGERALRSVIAQEFPAKEIILVDDASPDAFVVPDSLAADSRIRLIRHQKNLGESGARNTGIANATCEWIAFLDSDDYWLKGKLAEQTKYVEEHQHGNIDPLAFYATGFIRIKADGRVVQALYPVESSSTEDFASGCWFMPGSTVLFNKALAEAAGPWDTNLRRSNDLDWYLRAALAGGKLYVAPVIGSVVEIGARPSPAVVAAASSYLEAKWVSADAIEQLPRYMQRLLVAYLDIERAASARSHGDIAALAGNLLHSLLMKPRLQLHLKKWWRSASPVSGVSPEDFTWR